MRIFIYGLAVVAVALTAASPAAAFEKPESESEIVVEGRKSQREQIRDFARTLTPVGMDEHIGRFIEPVCPAVFGLQPHEASSVIARYRQVARASGVLVAGERCRANAMVIVVNDKAKFIESIPRYAPDYLRGLSDKKIARLANSSGPTAGWQVTGLLDANGLPLLGTNLSSHNPVAAPIATSVDQSRLVRATQAHFMASLLIVEWAALANVSTRQLADYAAMRTLAPVDPLSHRHRLAGNPNAALPAPSILALFDPGRSPADAPASVTWWDFAFLQALYDTRGNRSALIHRGDIQSRMKKILAGAPQSEL